MNEFGQWLRFYRERCNDPAARRGRISQARLGELLGEKIGVDGYSGAAVSEWERGRSKISADDRRMLISLVQVLREHGGIQTITEANAFLMSGNYRPLNAEEQHRIFPDVAAEQPAAFNLDSPDQWRLVIIFLGELIFRPTEEVRDVLKKLAGGPPPQWPGVLLGVLGWPMRHASIYAVLRMLLWIGVWALALWLIFPFMQWPFDSEADALRAAAMFAAGTLVIPLAIGILTDTDHSDFWKAQRKLSRPGTVRLLTHQGSLIGFQVGSLLLFAAALALHYLGLGSISTWRANLVRAISAAGLVIFAYASARQTPLNLLRAYGAVRLADGAVFFTLTLLGPAWSLFFLYAYPQLLLFPAGPLTFFAALIGITGLMALRHRHSGSTIIPAHWWAVVYGTITVLYLFANGASLWSIALFTGLVVAFAALAAWMSSRQNRRQ